MAKNSDRVTRDAAGVGPDPAVRSRLVPLHELKGYGIADGEPDIRGWDVRTLSGREIGEVEDLLVDPERGEVVMLEVDMRGDNVHAEVPIRSVQLDRGRKQVLVDSADVDGGVRNDIRARDRMRDDERERLRESYGTSERHVSYGEGLTDRQHGPGEGGTEETVIERRPMVEDVIVRRRPVDE